MAKRPQATLDDLLVQLKISNRLAAAQLRSSMLQHELILLLASTGATQQEIADVLGTTAPVVQVTLSRIRQKGNKKA